jgi:hypothetical protein
MIDIKCRGFGCQIRERCLRYTETAKPMQQMYYFPSPNRGTACEKFIAAPHPAREKPTAVKAPARKPAKRSR